MNVLKRIDLDNPKKTTESFIYNCFPVLAHVKGNTPSEIVSKLQENKDYDIYGERYSGSDILRLWRFFYETNPSAYIPKSATKCTAISCAVPIVMLAYKTQYDTPYEKWRGDKYTKLMMGRRNLGWLVGDSEDKNAQELDFSELATKWPVATLREYLTDFLSDDDKINPVTSYKAKPVGDKEFDKLPANLKRMLLQTWVFSPEVRHSNMITDPNDWDGVPAPLYEVELSPWDAIIPSKPSNDLPW